MPDVLKVLAQVAPPPNTLTDAYAVPGATQAVVARVSVANRGASRATYRLSIAVAGAADDVKQYTDFDIPIDGNTSHRVDMGGLGAADVVRVYSSSSLLSFTVFGMETG